MKQTLPTLAAAPGADVDITYTNHRGVTSTRRICISGVFFGESAWHDGRQWFIAAYDYEKDAPRTFAMSGLKGWAQSRGPAKR